MRAAFDLLTYCDLQYLDRLFTCVYPQRVVQITISIHFVGVKHSIIETFCLNTKDYILKKYG